MGLIRNLKEEYDGLFARGVFDSKSLFQGEMPVELYLDEGATEEDGEKCIEHYNRLLEKQMNGNKWIFTKISLHRSKMLWMVINQANSLFHICLIRKCVYGHNLKMKRDMGLYVNVRGNRSINV